MFCFTTSDSSCDLFIPKHWRSRFTFQRVTDHHPKKVTIAELLGIHHIIYVYIYMFIICSITFVIIDLLLLFYFTRYSTKNNHMLGWFTTGLFNNFLFIRWLFDCFLLLIPHMFTIFVPPKRVVLFNNPNKKSTRRHLSTEADEKPPPPPAGSAHDGWPE